MNDRHQPAPPDWDARTVTDSEQGAVAADDANRIIAVSRPLAAALGWVSETSWAVASSSSFHPNCARRTSPASPGT